MTHKFNIGDLVELDDDGVRLFVSDQDTFEGKNCYDLSISKPTPENHKNVGLITLVPESYLRNIDK